MKKMLENADPTDNWGQLVIGSAYGINTMTQKLINTPQDYQEKEGQSLEIRLLEKYYDYLYKKKKNNEFNQDIITLSATNQDALLEPTFQGGTVDKSWLETILPEDKIEEFRKMFELVYNKIDFSKVGFGIEKSAGLENEFGLKQEASVVLGNVIFMGGNDSGYVHSYVGGEAGMGGVLNIGISANVGGSLFMTFAETDEYKEHINFEGKYKYGRGGIGVGTGLLLGGLDISVGTAYTYAQGEVESEEGKEKEVSWNVLSYSTSVGVGGGLSPVTPSVTAGIGKTAFINKKAVDTPKTKWEKLKSYIKFIIPH